MTCWISSSSARCLLLAVAAAGALAGCAHGAAPARESDRALARVAILPGVNVSGRRAPLRDIEAELERALAREAIDVVGGDAVSTFLADRRIRYTGGVESATAVAARDQLGVDGVLVTSIELHQASPPKLALTARLVSAEEEPVIVWMDGIARAGRDSRGLLGLGEVTSIERLRREALSTLARSLALRLGGKGPRSPACAGGGTFETRLSFRSDRLDSAAGATVAVLPFENETKRKSAGEAIAVEIARQLVGVESLRVLEPGAVRERLLAYRVIYADGVSLEHARVVSAGMGVDLLVTGVVREFEDSEGEGEPRVNFSVVAIDGRSKDVVWQSTSYARGNDRVKLFDFGRISTATSLACQMARGMVRELRIRGDGGGALVRPGASFPSGARRPIEKPAPQTQSLRAEAGPADPNMP